MHKHLGVTIAIMLLAGCGAVCENEVSETSHSPSGKMKAVVFNRGCGATVGFNTQVSVLPAGADLPDDRGNVLIVDDKAPLKLEWQSDQALRITGRFDTRVFKQESSADGIQVTYTR